LFGTRLNKGYGWLYISNELAQKGVCDSIIVELNKNQQIDWYLQAELAYNKRFGENTIKDQKDK
jgi:regulatory protein